MISILVANAKGGCGKSTIATNLAAAFANAGHRTALADADRQRSTLTWLKTRPKSVAPIVALDWRKETGKVPDGVERLVIDAGAGVTSARVRDLLKRTDIVIMPILPSVFDEAATRRFLKKVDELKPIRKGRKPVEVVGNRMRTGTHAARELDAFLVELGHEVVARLGDLALYAAVARQGLGVFDLAPSRRARAEADWAPLLRRIAEEEP